MPFPGLCIKNLISLIKEEKLTIAVSLIFSVICFFSIIATDFDKKIIAFLLFIPIFFLLHFNTNIVIGLTVILLFTRSGAFSHTIAVLFSIPLLYSYLVTYRNNPETVKTSNPVALPFFIYCLTIIPSFTNVSNIWQSLNYSFNMLAIAIYIFVLSRYIKDYKQIKYLASIFVVCTLLNGIDIFRKGLMKNDRDFGFMGVVFVDFVCVAIIITLIVALYKKNSKSWNYVLLSGFLFLTLIYTQTRNTLISLMLTLFCGFVYISINSKLFGLQIKNIIRNSILIFGLLLLIITAVSNISPNISNRFSELFIKKQITVNSEEDFSQSSIVTRLLIWYTCLNAFVEHPIIGIGYYSFRFESERYYTMPTALYDLFVRGLSSHVTYLSVVTETGIIGFIGFLIFLISSIMTGCRSIIYSKNNQQRFLSFGIFLLQLYIAFSMAMSDAWLWDQCGMLWGIILGISIANYKIIKENSI